MKTVREIETLAATPCEKAQRECVHGYIDGYCGFGELKQSGEGHYYDSAYAQGVQDAAQDNWEVA